MVNVAADLPFNAPGMNSYKTSNTLSNGVNFLKALKYEVNWYPHFP